MRICAKSVRSNYVDAAGGVGYLDTENMVFVGREATPDDIRATVPDAEIIFADAITPVTAEDMDALPNLKMIHSEGVAFNKIDIQAAAERGIFACNNAGGNAGAVAEQCILLMLGCQRSIITGDAAVRAGQQIQMKQRCFAEGITDLADSTVGIVGMGAIGQALTARLQGFGTRVVYTSRTRKPALEDQLGIEWMESLDQLLAEANIVSLHSPVTEETRGMANDEFFAKMQPGSWLINTARGELVDNQALIRALESGRLAGAGFDTVAPEPVLPDNELLQASEEARSRMVFSPHIGGITTGSRMRMQRHMWENVAALERGDEPTGIVNKHLM